MSVEVVLSLTSPIFLVVLLFGCFSCLFKKKGFQNFRPRDAHNAQNNPAFSVDVTDVANTLEQITIEPLPDILSKTSTVPCFKPRIVCKERGKQEAFLSLISVQRSFPRDHLTYINEIGSGWFGQAIESEAAYLVEASTKTKVVVKILKDDASKLEQKQFMEEVTVFRCLDHVNVLSFLGQCTDALPYLVILEFSHYGNLKTYLIDHRHDKDKWIKKNRLIRFSLDVAAGLACLHRHDYVHNDLSARNCLVMSNNAIKIGDYGISDTLFKDDYYNSGRELLPIRWMAPETLIQVDGTWTSSLGDKETDIWSFGILLWEIFTLGEQPYSMLSDEAVLQGVVLDKCVLPTKMDLKVPQMDQLWLVMAQCWQSPLQRLDIEQVHQNLEQIIAADAAATVTADISTDFDQKWQTLMPNRPELGSRTALAGSFLNEDSSSPTSVQSYLLGGELGAGDTPGLDEVLIGGQLDKPGNDHRVEMDLDFIVNESSRRLSESKPVKNSQLKHLNLNNEILETQISNGTSLAPLFIPQISSTTVEMPTLIAGSAKDPKDQPITVSITSKNTDQLLTSKEDLSLSSQGFSGLSGMEEGAGDSRKDNPLTNESNNNLMNMHSTSFSLEEDFTEFARTSPRSPIDDFTESQLAVDSSEEIPGTHNDFSEFVSSATKDITAEDPIESKDDFDEFVTFSQPPESQVFTENLSSLDILSDFKPFSKSESLPAVSEAKINAETNVNSSHLFEVEKASDESNNNHHHLSSGQPPFSLLESVDDTITSLPSNPFFAVDVPDSSTNSVATNLLSLTGGISDLTSDLNSSVGLGSVKQPGPAVAEVLGESEGIAAFNSASNIPESLQHRSLSDQFEPFDTKKEESKLEAGLEKVGTGSPCSLASSYAKSVITFGGISTDLNLSSIHSKISAQPASSTCSDDFGQECLVDKYNFSPQSLLVPPSSSHRREGAEDDGSCRVLLVEYTDDSHENSTSPLDSDTEGSTCSSSSREYLCTGVSDTGQPPTGELAAQTSEDHLDDKAYQLISEIY
ncbi:unnamed protein product, partial [Lymnaea stagnalis]